MNGKVCAKCQIEMRTKENGVVAAEMTVNGPSKLWSADLWYCPECGLEALLGFGGNPIHCSFQSDVPTDDILKSYEAEDKTIIKFWLNAKERDCSEG